MIRFPAALTTAALLALLGLAVPGAASAGGGAAAFRRAGNHVCATARAKANRIPQPRSPSDLPNALRQAEAIYDAEIAQLAKLHPPANARRPFASALAAMRRESAALHGALRQVQAGKSVVATFGAVSKTLARLAKQAKAGFRKAGLKTCAR